MAYGGYECPEIPGPPLQPVGRDPRGAETYAEALDARR